MSTTIDQQFVEYVIKSLVGKPEEVKVERTIDEKGVLLTLTVDPEDLGRVIGKRGATAQSVRTLLRALGTKNEARYNLKIVDNGAQRPERVSDDRQNSAGGVVSDDSWSSTTSSASDDDDTTSIAEADDDSSERLSKTRAELADLDDLDV
jgi:hypothetical protein